MALIRDASVEAVKAAGDIVAVISARTPLRKAGARYVGRCPFHDERTPSFSVNPADKLYYCFGCGAKGDLITFVRETEQLDFAGAVEWLADRFNVELEYEETSPEQDARRRRRERLLAVQSHELNTIDGRELQRVQRRSPEHPVSRELIERGKLQFEIARIITMIVDLLHFLFDVLPSG